MITELEYLEAMRIVRMYNEKHIAHERPIYLIPLKELGISRGILSLSKMSCFCLLDLIINFGLNLESVCYEEEFYYKLKMARPHIGDAAISQLKELIKNAGIFNNRTYSDEYKIIIENYKNNKLP